MVSARAGASNEDTRPLDQDASKPKPDGYAPHQNTVWLCEDRNGWMAECRNYLADRYGTISGTLLQVLPVNRLGPNHEIVVLYYESKRSRSENGKKIVSSRSVVQSQPIKCSDFYAVGANPDDISIDVRIGGIRVGNERLPDGRTQPGLCDSIQRMCHRPNLYGKMAPTVRAMYRVDTQELRVARD